MMGVRREQGSPHHKHEKGTTKTPERIFRGGGDPGKLFALRDKRCRSSAGQIIELPQGDYGDGYFFMLIPVLTDKDDLQCQGTGHVCANFVECIAAFSPTVKLGTAPDCEERATRGNASATDTTPTELRNATAVPPRSNAGTPLEFDAMRSAAPGELVPRNPGLRANPLRGFFKITLLCPTQWMWMTEGTPEHGPASPYL